MAGCGLEWDLGQVGQIGRRYFAFLRAIFSRYSGRKISTPDEARTKAVVTAMENLMRAGQRASCRVATSRPHEHAKGWVSTRALHRA